jgi:hypothetical protein
MTMKRASQLRGLFQLGMTLGICLYLFDSLVHKISPFDAYIFTILTPISIIGYLYTYRKTRHGRLAALEQQKRREMVTPEEYAAKRQEILNDL